MSSLKLKFSKNARRFWDNTSELASGATAGIQGFGGNIRNKFSHMKTTHDMKNLNTEKVGKFLRGNYLRRQQQIRNRKVVFTLSFVVVGMVFMVVALSLPEWFILIQFEGIIEGHVGFFYRCEYGPEPNEKMCLKNTISETATCVAMFIMALLSGLGALFCGIFRIIKTKGKPRADDGQSSAFKRMRFLILAAAVCSFCGVGSFTYLYNEYLQPVGASYVMGWICTGFLFMGGVLGYCFEEKNAKNSVTELSERKQQCSVISISKSSRIQDREPSTTKEGWNSSRKTSQSH